MDSLENHERVLVVSRLLDQWADDALGDEPDWKPLSRLLSYSWCGGFMWMNRVEQDDATIELYKHGITRHYLNLDRQGRAYAYTGSDYVQIPMNLAIERVFEGLEDMGHTRETDYDDEFVAAKYKALREAGWIVVSVGSPDSAEPLRSLADADPNIGHRAEPDPEKASARDPRADQSVSDDV
ncbi:MAG: hypothetical protein O6951_10920 [Actinobacteria bacterium]|nr:hypothetical protein [Actinomycetota bacterium]